MPSQMLHRGTVYPSQAPKNILRSWLICGERIDTHNYN